MQDWLSHRVRATPKRTALVRASTGETLDFANIGAMVDDLAGRLAALGVESGDHLGMVMETRLAAVCTVHAADRLGAVLVPLGDGLTDVELAGQLDAADVTTLVCSADTESRAVDAFEGPVCSVDDTEHDAVASLAEAVPRDVSPPEWGLDDTRLLLFTSGTTGEPKAVRLTQGNLLWSAIASVFRLGFHCDDRWLVGLSLHHMGGLSPVLRMPLYGMTVVLQESFDPGRTADNIGSYDVTSVSLVPTMLKRMLDSRGTLADSLRVVLLGGAPAPDGLLQRCRDFSVPIHPTYGMTETASQVATATPKEAFNDIGTVGRPLYWTSVTVRDADGAEVEHGQPGELVVDGPTVSPGYYGNREATDAAFGPYGLRTGDVGYCDENGRLFVLGRVDDQIITGGENVHPREVSDVLRSHPMVADVAVVGLPDEEWGELVGALVVPRDDDLTSEDLESYCRERLAAFKLPRVLSFVEELPLTDSGTVRRADARAHLVEGMNERDTETGLDVSVEPPLSPAENTEDDVSETAGVESSSVDTDDQTAADTDDQAETFLIGGADWNPGETVSVDDDHEVTGLPTAESDDATVVDEAPETPDFVREVLPDDDPNETGGEVEQAGEPEHGEERDRRSNENADESARDDENGGAGDADDENADESVRDDESGEAGDADDTSDDGDSG